MLERSTCSRAVARALTQAASRVDLTDVLPSLRVPTLVLVTHSVAHPVIHEHAAGLIPGAQLRHLQSPSRPTGLGDFWEPVVDEIEPFMTGHRRAAAPTRTYAVLLFTDIVSSTEHAARMGDAAWRSTLLHHDSLLLDEVEAAGGDVTHPTGDGALSASDGPEQAIRCATRIVDKVHALGIQVRAGVHVGECERVGQDLAGITVHVGARVAAKADADEILITEPTRALLAGSGFVFSTRGDHKLKGVPGSWPLSAVTATPPHHLQAKDTTRDLRASDRAVLLAARRAPRLLQVLGSLANRRLRKTS
jgi:class 3 adenylate cyclase